MNKYLYDNGFISKDGKSVHILHSLAFTLILLPNMIAYCNTYFDPPF